MTDSKRSGNSSLRSKLQGIPPAYLNVTTKKKCTEPNCVIKYFVFRVDRILVDAVFPRSLRRPSYRPSGSRAQSPWLVGRSAPPGLCSHRRLRTIRFAKTQLDQKSSFGRGGQDRTYFRPSYGCRNICLYPRG